MNCIFDFLFIKLVTNKLKKYIYAQRLKVINETKFKIFDQSKYKFGSKGRSKTSLSMKGIIN